MKKASSFLLFVLILTILAGCSGDSEGDIPSGMKKAGNDAVDYYFYFSDSWEVDRDDGMISIKRTPDSSGISNVSLSVMAGSLSSEKSKYGVNDQWKEYSEDLYAQFGSSFQIKKGPNYLDQADDDESSEEASSEETESGISDISENSETSSNEYEGLKLDDAPALRVEYVYNIGKNRYRAAQVIAIRNGYVYTITFVALDEDVSEFDKYVSIVDTVVENFHFK